MKGDSLGDRMKVYEGLEADRRLMPLLPVMGRFDGKAFHTFCRGLKKPFDVRLHALMVEVTKFLVEETQALVGYTQSDEISLVWYSDDYDRQMFFDGRASKMATVVTALATAKFTRLLPQYIPEKAHRMPVFDGRVWTVPNQTEAANTFLWREQDATRNSIVGLGRAYFSHAELHGKDTKQVQEMLFQQHGVNWAHCPVEQRRGTWVRKNQSSRPFTAGEVANLPPKHKARTDPNLMVERTWVGVFDMPKFGSVKNREAVLFEGVEPVIELAVSPPVP